MEKIKILAISGSIRKDSYNTYLLKAAKEVAPQNAEIELYDIKDIPFYNGDIEVSGLPEAVIKLGEKIKQADALLFGVPEYNYSYTAVLKNAIDWASRIPGSILNGKSAAMVGGSMGPWGTIRAQLHFRQVMIYLDVRMMNKPEILVPFVQNVIDKNGNITDEQLKSNLKLLVESLVKFALQNKS